MPLDLPLHPAFDHSEAADRVPNPKVVHPTLKDRIDFRDHILHRLAFLLPDNIAQLGEQGRPLLQFRNKSHPPLPATAWKIVALETGKFEAFPFLQIDYPALLFVDLTET